MNDQNELGTLRAKIAEQEALINQLLTDPTYEGGVQYWIQKHDMLMTTSLKTVIKLSEVERQNKAMLCIVDAAFEVAGYAKNNEFPIVGSQGFFRFTEFIDVLDTALRAYKQALSTPTTPLKGEA
jgi:hypothetical protein